VAPRFMRLFEGGEGLGKVKDLCQMPGPKDISKETGSSSSRICSIGLNED